MRSMTIAVSPAALLLVATAAFANIEPPPRDPQPQPSTPDIRAREAASPRQEAEASYALAYEEVGRADREVAQGKAKNAQKLYRRALERSERAVQLEPTYHEAWNLVGYSARKVGDHDRALKAYERCLLIKPDYAPAREYLGETWLEKGDAKKARDQLVWLERLGATAEAKKLKAALDAWSAARPDSARGAAADSGAAASTGSD